MNVRKEAGLMNPETGEYFELDLYLPSLNLAFEYQVSFTLQNKRGGGEGEREGRKRIWYLMVLIRACTTMLLPNIHRNHQT